MGGSWENEVVRKKDLVDWLQKAASTYQDLQCMYRDRIDYTKEMAILYAVADCVRCMKPYDGKVEEKYGQRLGESDSE